MLRQRPFRGHQGMTLVEVLMALAILLVGVYTVAAVFPTLQRQILREGKFEQGARMANDGLAEWQVGPAYLPERITESPSLATGAVLFRTGDVSTVSDNVAGDVTFLPMDPNEAIPGAEMEPVRNPLKDLRDVIGEKVTIVAPTAPLAGMPTLSLYLLRLGPAIPATITVWERVPYTAGTRGSLTPGQFAVDPVSGAVETSPLPGTIDSSGAAYISVSYSWVDRMGSIGAADMAYGFQNEVVRVTYQPTGLAIGSVAPLRNGYGGSIVPGTIRVFGLRRFTPVPRGNTPNSGQFAVTQPGETAEPLGAAIFFNIADAGRRVEISYRIRDWSILSEDHSVPFYEPFGVRLEVAPLWVANTDTPIPQKDSLYPASGGVQVAAFDLTDGSYITDTVELAGQAPALYERGQALLGPARAGHKLRFYYRALDNRATQIVCANRSYVPIGNPGTPLLSHALPPGGVEPNALDRSQGYLLRQVGPTSPGLAVPGAAAGAWIMLFSPSEAGKAVNVTYSYAVGAGPAQRAQALASISSDGLTYLGAEWHYAVIGPLAPATPLALRSMDAVNGASVKARTWWTDDKGRYQRADADGFISPTA